MKALVNLHLRDLALCDPGIAGSTVNWQHVKGNVARDGIGFYDMYGYKVLGLKRDQAIFNVLGASMIL
jgi:hypothetical protein